MAITELRNGEENGYKVEFVKSLPKDKTIIALHSNTATAFLVAKANNYEWDKELVLYPITDFEKTSEIKYMKESELLNDNSEFEILALNTLNDIKEIKSAWAYS